MTTKKTPKTEAELQVEQVRLLREILKALREQTELLKGIRDVTEQAAGWVRLTG